MLAAGASALPAPHRDWPCCVMLELLSALADRLAFVDSCELSKPMFALPAFCRWFMWRVDVPAYPHVLIY
jgi:hypothetical protein